MLLGWPMFARVVAAMVPPLIVSGPVKVFSPVSESTPAPDLFTESTPLPFWMIPVK